MIAKQNTQKIDDFKLENYDNISHQLKMMMGEKGILLCFTGDLWDVGSVRSALWLQRQSFKLSKNGINCAMIAPNETHELRGFYMSLPNNIPCPLLADPSKSVTEKATMESPGYLLLNRDGDILGRWYADNSTAINVREVLQSTLNF